MLSHAARPNPRPFRENRFLQGLCAVYALVWLVVVVARRLNRMPEPA